MATNGRPDERMILIAGKLDEGRVGTVHDIW